MKKANLLQIASACRVIVASFLFSMVGMSAQAQCPLACNPQLVQVSLGTTCTALITPAMILPDGGASCPAASTFVVDKLKNGIWVPANVNLDDINQTVMVRVRAVNAANATINTCWGSVLVEDKVGPTLNCADITVTCADYNFEPPTQFASDNCAGQVAATSQLINEIDLPCGSAGNISYQKVYQWTATANGMTATCTQNVFYTRLQPTASTIDCPDDVTINCPGTAAAVSPAGLAASHGAQFAYPRLGLVNLTAQSYCELQVTYEDQVIPVCPGTRKILRTWTIIDWCAAGPVNPITCLQLIKVQDTEGPSFACPADATISTSPYTCDALYSIPAINITDNCSAGKTLKAQYTLNGVVKVVNGTISAAGVGSFPAASIGPLPSCEIAGCGTVITITATDSCGNASSCDFKVKVEDQIPPAAICIQNTVASVGVATSPDTQLGCAAMNGNGDVLVNASSFDNGSYDNCGPVYFKARRMTTGCGGGQYATANFFDDKVKFCCADIGTTVTVVFRAYDVNPDAAPNTDGTAVTLSRDDDRANDCMVQVVVQDKLKPVCQAPASVTVSCTAFDPSLWAYGAATAYDNCNLDELTVSVFPAASVYQNTCFNGTITRTWTAYDCNSPRLSSQCTQTITVVNNPAYTINFPVDVTTTNCEPGSMPRPTITGDVCAQIGIDSSDEIFTVVPDACYKIVRTWKVINWCRYNPDTPCELVANNPSGRSVQTITNASGFKDNTGAALTLDNQFVAGGPVTLGASEGNACYIYKQVIKVTDNNLPTVADETAAEFCDEVGQNCTGSVILKALATDACAKSDVRFTHYMIDLNHTGTGFTADITNNISESSTAAVAATDSRRATISLELPYGTHRIKWFVTDRCGNIAFIEDGFTVRDCKAPTVFCTPHSTNMMAGGMTQPFWASDFFEYANDNCTAESYLNGQVRLRIINQAGTIVAGGAGTGYPAINYLPGTSTEGYQLSCAQGGPGLYTVHVYTRDEAGNADYCTTQLVVTDNVGACPSVGSKTVVGKVENVQAEGLQDATVAVTGISPIVGTFDYNDFTNVDGVYEFLNSIPAAQDVVITPTKNLPVASTQGISAYDIVLIQKHILGIAPLATPYQILAADVNASESVTGSDITEIRKFVLGITNALPSGKQYGFVPTSYVFPNANNPFTAAVPSSITIPVLASNMMDENFHSFKMADVSGDALFNSNQVEDRNNGTVYFDAENKSVKAGDVVTVNFNSADAVAAYQFTMNLKGLEVIEILPGEKMTSDNFAVHTSAITAVVEANATSFAVKFRATQDGSLSNMLNASDVITPSVAYDKEGTRSNVSFRFGGVVANGFELLQNTPNPVATSTAISFVLPEAGAANLTITNVEGKVIYTVNGDYAKGLNTVEISRASLVPGVLFYQLDTKGFSEVKKMIVTQ